MENISCSTKEPFRRRQLVEHDEQGEPDRISQKSFLLGTAPERPGRDRFRCVRRERFLAPRRA
jgi:hypothetical protein